MTDAPLLRVAGVGIRHDEAASFTPSDVTFDVAPGEVVLLLGPSGSGKSTLALALDGLIPHAVAAELRGTIEVAGTPTIDTTVARLSEHVAMVFQDPDAQVVTGSLLDEVCFGPENLRVPKDEVLARAESALRRVGLWDRRRDNPDLLSGGGRQRLAIACALALGSPVIVLDEPTANLDPAGIEEVYAALADLVADGDRSIVLVEHNLDAAIDLVDRVVVLDHDGRMVVDGDARTVLTTRAQELADLGVWLPVATIAGMRLGVDPLPVTVGELTAGVDRLPAAPAVEPLETRARPVSTGSTPGAAIQVTGLTVTKGRTRILDDVSLEVGAGDFLAIVGTNGAGKTTLLQAIAGVVPPPRGAIDLSGLDPARANPRDLARQVGFVFQNPEHQFIRHTVAEELAHALHVQRVPEDEIGDRVDHMLDRFGLAALREQHPFLLSGGQKRRLSVGTALIAGAPVLALDEPTFGQDRERAAELLDVLSGLNADGTTVLVVTHDLQLVAEHASHVAVMADGRLLHHGPTAEVLAGDTLLEAGLRLPPVAAAMRRLVNHTALHTVTRLADLPEVAR
ncbi:MAG: energy-coupling factor transporter ATPase [Aeromicrobium sp.]